VTAGDLDVGGVGAPADQAGHAGAVMGDFGGDVAGHGGSGHAEGHVTPNRP
jgi:hypothetical protein